MPISLRILVGRQPRQNQWDNKSGKGKKLPKTLPGRDIPRIGKTSGDFPRILQRTKLLYESCYWLCPHGVCINGGAGFMATHMRCFHPEIRRLMIPMPNRIIKYPPEPEKVEDCDPFKATGITA